MIVVSSSCSVKQIKDYALRLNIPKEKVIDVFLLTKGFLS